MRVSLLVVALLVSACAKEKSPDSTPVDSAETCTFHMTGTREFCDGRLMSAVAYDCGTQAGKRCFKFVHEPDSPPADTSAYDPAYVWSLDTVTDKICYPVDSGRGC